MTNVRDMSILTLDDQSLNTELVDSILRTSGFNNYQSINESLDLEEQLEQHPVDLLLLDLNMPIMDGFAVLEMLNEKFNRLTKPTVIMLTAQGDKDSLVKAMDLGASDYVTKPFDQLELIKRIEVHLQNRALTKELNQQKNHLEELVEQRTQDIREAYQEILARLGRASEYRDNETGNHIKRVSLFAELIANDLGFDKQYANLIRIATPMHDVGKIGIPDSIMLKPGKLTDEEFAKMKEHVTIGAEILSGHHSEFLSMSHEIALTHHEKFDGSGYPGQLKGEDIPITGRIVAIVDVFDALTSVRPYKRAWPVEEACDLIREQSGKHFDPKVVESFFNVLPDIIKVKERFADEI